MNKLESIVAVGVAGAVVVLAACTADKIPMMPATKPTQSVVVGTLTSPCPPPPPVVPVLINQVQVAGPAASVQVNPGKALIPQSGGSILWMFNASGYRLAANAVTFKASQPPGPSASSGSATEFIWCFGPTAASAAWKYNISFSPENDLTKIYDCDPTIVNSVGLTPLAVQTVSCTLRP